MDDASRSCRSDPLFRLLLGRWGLGERGVAVLTAVLGFGVLTAWYLVSLALDRGAQGRRGPFEYFTVTIGDLVLIPLLNGLAVGYVREVVGGLLRVAGTGGRPAGRLLALLERAYNTPLGLVFVLMVAIAAAGLQHVDELYGPDRNWTVPERGQLRPVALYHQLFFGVEAFIVAFLVFRHMVTVRWLLRLGRDSSPGGGLRALAERSLELYSWASLGWGAFVSLRVMDFLYLIPAMTPDAVARLPAPLAALVAYYLLACLTGLLPALAVRRRYGLDWKTGPVSMQVASLLAPLVGPAIWIVATRL